ncbi:MAG: SDR family NAD(P)-dependent oxidoreductase [Clostridia bacterium]|nr:SDR family NAD(P)-dependent oxidoreductase [Clostridia bacterium]MBQ7089943.1 SDR family NAD(P)-dependent oxidoreductase [Clostridia bacterium]
MKTALITGGSGAIGSMTAYLAVKKGWQVVLAYHTNQKAATDLQEDLERLGGKVLLFGGDLSKKEERIRLAEFAKEQCGKIDLLVNNFGTAHYCPFTDETDESIAEVLTTNLHAHMALTKLLLPPMIAAKSGAIVNVSSVWGQTGAACEVSYSAAKAGLIGFTKALAKELAPSGITVNCVAPGVVESKMLASLDRDALKEMIPTGKLCNGLDVANSIFFIAEQEQITGQVVCPNGGMYM